MRFKNYTNLTPKKHQTKYAIDLKFYFSMEDHKAFMRRCDEYGIVWINLLREFMHDAIKEEKKRYMKYMHEHNMKDDGYVPFLGYETKIRARKHFDNLKGEHTDERIRLHKCFYVLFSKTTKPVNPHLVWLMRDQHKIDDIKLFEHLLELMIEQGVMEEIISERVNGEKYYTYRPTVTIKTKRFNKKRDNPFVENDVKLMETAAENVRKGTAEPTRTERKTRRETDT